MLDYYEISVHQNGRHLFSTSTNSLQNRTDLETALRIFRKKFPSFEGYTVEYTHWECKEGLAPCRGSCFQNLLTLTNELNSVTPPEVVHS